MGLKSIVKLLAWGCLSGIVSLLIACAANMDRPPPEPVEAPLEYEPETPPAVASEAPVSQQQLPNIQYTIQVGAFSAVARAAKYADQLVSKGIDAYYFIDEDGLFKVRFERFDTKEAALSRAQMLQENELIRDFYIVQPRSNLPEIDYLAVLREDLVHTARRFIGTPYKWGGASPTRGFDCSGLTQTVYRLNGLELPRNACSQFQAGTPVSRESLQKGDLVFFATGQSRRVTHVGVYTGQGKFIHAPGRGKSIRTASLNNSYFKKRFLGARTYM
jgi:hypothetical protein